jgi:iron(III) transport system substrate-binding protein
MRRFVVTRGSRLGFSLLAGSILAVALGACSAQDEAQTSIDHSKEVVVYSARAEHLIKPLFDQYMKKTGAKITWLTDKEGPLLERIKAEGDRTPADLFMTVDAGNLWKAADEGVLQAAQSSALDAAVPEAYRDPEGRWYGLSLRSRTLVYNTNKVKPAELVSYAGLADPQWRGRLCLRTSKKVYNQSLVALMIQRYGEAKTEEIVRGWVANLAVPPFSNDTKAMEAVAEGVCDVTVVNTYYFGRLQKKNPDLPLAIAWPGQAADGTGVHMNVSGAGIVKHADNAAGARALLEWLASPAAQAQFAGLNMEFPVRSDVALDPVVANWGSFKADTLRVADAGRLQPQAVMLMDRAGWK